MRKVIAATTLALLTLGLSSTGRAGGWAVTTLDPIVEAPVAGQPFEVGFTIRQHGNHPVSMPDAAIIVTDAAGGTERFPATPSGAEGHHVATIEVRAPGELSWAVQQGGFGVQELGTLDVRTSSSADRTGGGSSPWPAPLFAIAAVLAGFGGVDLVRQRRQRRDHQPLAA